MSQPETKTDSPAPPLPQLSPMGGVLSYLVPGLGQVVQGRLGKGLFFMVVLLGMFHAGQAMAGWKNVYMPIVEQDPREPTMRRTYSPLPSIYQRWHFAGQFFIGVAAWPAIWQYYDLPMPGGDTNPFLRNFQREPMTREKQNRLAEFKRVPRPDPDSLSPEGELNREIAAGTKHWDVGWVYTVVAGVLNILVIYDAVAGPAFGARRISKPEEKPQAEGATT